jgi:hypothetical protein
LSALPFLGGVKFPGNSVTKKDPEISHIIIEPHRDRDSDTTIVVSSSLPSRPGPSFNRVSRLGFLQGIMPVNAGVPTASSPSTTISDTELHQEFGRLVSLLTVATAINSGSGHPTLWNSNISIARDRADRIHHSSVLDSVANILIQHTEIVAVTSLSESKMQGMVQQDDGESFNVDVQDKFLEVTAVSNPDHVRDRNLKMQFENKSHIDITRAELNLDSHWSSFTPDDATLAKFANKP